MRCCTCASDCKGFTTSLRKGGSEHEKEMDFRDPADTGVYCVVYFRRRRSGDAFVELVDACVVWVAADYFLASVWNSGAVPRSFRGIWAAWCGSFQYEAAHGRAAEEHDAGGAGAIPPRDAGAMWFWTDYWRRKRK